MNQRSQNRQGGEIRFQTVSDVHISPPPSSLCHGPLLVLLRLERAVEEQQAIATELREQLAVAETRLHQCATRPGGAGGDTGSSLLRSLAWEDRGGGWVRPGTPSERSLKESATPRSGPHDFRKFRRPGSQT